MKSKTKTNSERRNFWSGFVPIYLIYLAAVSYWLSGKTGPFEVWAFLITAAITIWLVIYLIRSIYLTIRKFINNAFFVWRSKKEIYFTNGEAIIVFKESFKREKKSDKEL